jgi:hypothetical protein
MSKQKDASKLDAAVGFYNVSEQILKMLYAIANLPPEPIPESLSKQMSDASKAHWQRLHPHIPDNSILREVGSKPRKQLAAWLEAMEAAYSQAPTNDLRADIANLGSLLGDRQRVMSDYSGLSESMRDEATLRILAEFTRNGFGQDVREFERCLSALRRQIQLAFVRENPQSPTLLTTEKEMSQTVFARAAGVSNKYVSEHRAEIGSLTAENAMRIHESRDGRKNRRAAEENGSDIARSLKANAPDHERQRR